MAVAYKNRNTGQVVAYPQADSRLEALNEWDRVGDDEITYTVADAHDRAAAERASIEAAAALRMDSAAGSAIAGVAAAAAYNTGHAAGEGETPGALPTLSTSDAAEKQQPVPLLAKDDALRDPATTAFEENKRLAEEEILHPPTDGVLKRAKRDHKRGATQIGPNPGEHAGPRAAKAAKDAGVDPAADPTAAGDNPDGSDTTDGTDPLTPTPVV